MSQLNLLFCFLFVIVVEGVYYQRKSLSRCIREDTICDKRPIYYCDNYRNYRMLCPRRCRACRSQTRNTVRSRHTDEYQRQGPQTDDNEKQLGRKIHSFFQHQEWIKPVSNNEEGKTLNYNLREDDPQSTNSRRDRNNEKGPGSNYGSARSGTYVYQTRTKLKPVLNYNLRGDNQQSAKGDRNYEKVPRTGYTRSGADGYQRRGSNGNVGRDNKQSTRGHQNYEKGPRTGYTRSVTEEHQRRASNGNVGRDNKQRTRGDRSYEKGPRTGYTRSRTDEYVRRASNGNARRDNQQSTRGDGNQGQRTGSYVKLEATDVLEQDRLQSLASTTKYGGCKDRGLYCRYWKYVGCCDKPLGRRLCSRTCSFCLPMNPVCPRSYKFGCCWDGVPARDPKKKSCRACKNRSAGICRRQAVYRECDLYSANTLETRALCPQTCGACYDYSTYA